MLTVKLGELRTTLEKSGQGYFVTLSIADKMPIIYLMRLYCTFIDLMYLVTKVSHYNVLTTAYGVILGQMVSICCFTRPVSQYNRVQHTRNYYYGYSLSFYQKSSV